MGEDHEGGTEKDGLGQYDDIAAEPPEEEEEGRGEEGDSKSKYGDCSANKGLRNNSYRLKGSILKYSNIPYTCGGRADIVGPLKIIIF